MQDRVGSSLADLTPVLAKAAAGDAEAWRMLVNGYSRKVYGYLLKRTQNVDLAEELTQATFVKIVEKLNNFKGYKELGRFESWLFRIAVNKLRDEMRRRNRQARAISSYMQSGTDERSGNQAVSDWDRIDVIEDVSSQSPLEQLSMREQIELIKVAVGKLSEEEQEVLYLRHTGGLSFAQIAQVLGQPIGTVLARVHRALNKLRIMLDGPVQSVTRGEPDR